RQRGRGDLRRQRPRGAHLQGEAPAEAPLSPLRPVTLVEEGCRPTRPRRADRAVRGRGGGGLMPSRKRRPTSPGRRFGTYPMREELSGAKPAKSLTKGKTSSGGRNSGGRVTARHRGGGAKRRYRQIDFKRTKDGIPARVAS